jgi:plastocyanin
MRRMTLTVAVLAAALTLGGTAAASSPAAVAAKKPPVKLEGKVTNKGTKTVKNGKIEVEIDDFYFKPTFIKGKAGTKVKVELENEGNTTHTFTIDDQNIDKEFKPGQKKTIKVKIPATGVANFYCRFHHDQGMQGAVFSQAGATASSSAKTTSSGSSGSGGYNY